MFIFLILQKEYWVILVNWDRIDWEGAGQRRSRTTNLKEPNFAYKTCQLKEKFTDRHWGKHCWMHITEQIAGGLSEWFKTKQQ